MNNPNSRARKGGGEKWREVKEGVWKNLTRGECGLWRNGATQSATCCTVCKRSRVGIEHGRFENVGSVLKASRHIRHPAVDALPSVHPFSRLIQHAGKWLAYSSPHPQGGGVEAGKKRY